jgi:hypothetical protein
MEVHQETAVAQFLILARSCQERRLKAPEVARELIKFYREVRVSGTNLEADHDMLLFQWGTGQQWLLSEPTDLRGLPDGQLDTDNSESQYLDFTRQVFAPGDDEEAEFDDLAIQMGITLVYGPATGREESGNMWISSLNQLEAETNKFSSQPLVSLLLNATPSRYVAVVGLCG